MNYLRCGLLLVALGTLACTSGGSEGESDGGLPPGAGGADSRSADSGSVTDAGGEGSEGAAPGGGGADVGPADSGSATDARGF